MPKQGYVGLDGGRYKVRTCDPCRVKAEKCRPKTSIELHTINKINDLLSIGIH